MAKTFEQLVYEDRLQPSNFGRTTIKRQEDQGQPTGSSARRKKVDAYENAVDAAYAKEQEGAKKLIEHYGTDDPEEAAELEATGALDRDLDMRMRLDPVGTRAAVDRAVAIHNARSAPDTSQYREGVGKGGERYFTNLTNAELNQQGPSGQLDIEEPVSALHAIDPTRMGGGGNVGGGKVDSPEMTVFEGKLARAQGIAEKPERDVKRLKARYAYAQTITDYSLEHGATAGLEKIRNELMDGTLGAMGLQPEDAARVEQQLIKNAKTPAQMMKARGLPPEMKIPWTKGGDKPGQAADPALPADVLNPGGGPSVMAQEKVRKSQVEAENMDIVEQGLGAEIPRTAHYAKGGKAPQPRSMQDRGGRGKPGLGGAIEDALAFTEGEGRYGYGESGPTGLAKDIAAFYGPRVPGMAFSAVLGGKGLGGIGGKLKGLRSVENALGLF